MEWDEIRWDEMRWNGMGWDWMGRLGRNGKGWDGIGWDKIGWIEGVCAPVHDHSIMQRSSPERPSNLSKMIDSQEVDEVR